MSSPITVRRATDDDIDFVAQDGYLPEAVVARRVAEGNVLLASYRGEPAGYLRLEHLWSRLPYIELIRVLEPYRRRGVGRALLAFAEENAAAAGLDALYSSSQADEPEPQAWHRRMGFEECGIIAGVNAGGVGEIFFRKAVR